MTMQKPAKGTKPLLAAEQRLRSVALSLPETTEDFPWGHRAIKVKGKAVTFMGVDGDELFVSVKLPRSSGGALLLPFAQPTGYGLGKAGWITATFQQDDDVPLGLLEEWLRESYVAVAPKKLGAALAAPTTAEAAKATKAKRAGRTKPATGRGVVVVPAALGAALGGSARARKAFDALPPSHQRQYCTWVAEAKKEHTRAGRAAKAVEEILAGARRAS